MSTQRLMILGLAVAAIIGAIVWLSPMKAARLQGVVSEISGAVPEITSPAGFINIPSPNPSQASPITINSLVGKKVILVDFWTYSCINCQRTLPYVNAWYEKYKDNGLEIIGVHTPEFDFEKEFANVQAAVNKYGIKYPVVLDNDYGTWTAYQNRYWPRKYLIDINGKIVYDHIGEGAYEETEAKIQELLKERAQKLGDATLVEDDIAKPKNVIVASGQARSPEVYFGAFRNELLASGEVSVIGVQNGKEPENAKLNQLYLVGEWDIQKEFAQNAEPGDKIVFRYSAKNVYMVASSEEEVELVVRQDGKLIKTLWVRADDLYSLIDNVEADEHLLELEIKGAGLKAFTFTFG